MHDDKKCSEKDKKDKYEKSKYRQQVTKFCILKLNKESQGFVHTTVQQLLEFHSSQKKNSVLAKLL